MDLFSSRAVVDKAAHLAGEAYEELGALSVRMRPADGFARDVVDGEEAPRRERQVGELGGDQAPAKIARVRERVQRHPGQTGLRDTSEMQRPHRDLERFGGGPAVDVGHDRRRVAAHDRIGGNALLDDGARLDNRAPADDDSRGNGDVGANRREAADDHVAHAVAARTQPGADHSACPDCHALLEANTTEEPRADLHIDVVLEHYVADDNGVIVEHAIAADRGARSNVYVREDPAALTEVVAFEPRTRMDEGGHREPTMIARATVWSAGQIHETSTISPEAEIGQGVTVGPYVVIHANVSLGDGSFVDSHTIVGAPTGDYYANPETYEPALCQIGEGAVIRSHSVVYSGVRIGEDFECGHHVTIREGTRLGDGVRIGTSSDVQREVTIGDYARLHSNVFVASRSTLEALTWLFPYVVLIDDPHPPSDTCTQGPTIRTFAAVGAGSMVSAGVEVGEGAVVGAMSLVRRDVPPNALAIGIPAKVVGTSADVVCREGRLDCVYPWWHHFRRGYPDGVLPDPRADA
jgi:acetyltransferase-like isoleucine patch superfamily enzyme